MPLDGTVTLIVAVVAGVSAERAVIVADPGATAVIKPAAETVAIASLLDVHVTLVHALKEVQLRVAYPVEAGAPTLTLGGGYREVASSVGRSLVAEWLRGVHGRIAAGVRGHAAPTIGASTVTR